jgi:hypothetical protein
MPHTASGAGAHLVFCIHGRREDDYFFGVRHLKIHESWSFQQGTLVIDRRLNFERASRAELKKRTLTNLYNQRPTWLDLAGESTRS